uniref:Uncharacterized protein n=1 Tax=Rhipicephalus zambeziensis TaxID=60191 RepID=A0A224YEA4_9ACAR
MATRLTGAARLGDDVAACGRSCGHHVLVAQQDCASVVCSAACGVVSVLPSPLCDPAGWCYGSLRGSKNGGVGFETKMKWLTCGTIPLVSSAKQENKSGGQYSVFLASGKFSDFNKNLRESCSLGFLDGGTSQKSVAWRVGCRLVCLVYITLVWFFCGSFIYDEGACDPFLSRPSNRSAPPRLSCETH